MIEEQIENIDEELHQKKLKEEKLSQEVDQIDDEIDQTISDLKGLQTDTNDKVNEIENKIE